MVTTNLYLWSINKDKQCDFPPVTEAEKRDPKAKKHCTIHDHDSTVSALAAAWEE